MAGRFEVHAAETSVRPECADSEVSEQDVADELAHEDYGRVGLQKEDEAVRRLVGPKLPSQEEVD